MSTDSLSGALCLLCGLTLSLGQPSDVCTCGILGMFEWCVHHSPLPSAHAAQECTGYTLELPSKVCLAQLGPLLIWFKDFSEHVSSAHADDAQGCVVLAVASQRPNQLTCFRFEVDAGLNTDLNS